MGLGRAMVCIAVLGAAIAPPSEASPTNPNYPFQFKVRGTNGYRVEVSAFPGGRLSLATVHPLPGGGSTGVVYQANGKISQKRIRVRLGGLGRVTVRVRSSGRRIHDTQCHHNYTYVARQATYAGRIRFHGEGGYTTVNSSRPRPTFPARDPILCALTLAQRKTGPIILHAQEATHGVRFFAVSDTFLGTVAGAVVRDQIERVKIARYTEAVVPPFGFTVDSPLTVADVRSLGDPFQGSAHFDRGSSAPPSGSLTGSLATTFPGGASTVLAGPGFAALLEPYYLFDGPL